MNRTAPPAPLLSDWAEPSPDPRRRRRWRDKFREAFRGVKIGVRGEASFAVHFFFATLVVTAAITLDCNLLEWCVLLMCIGGVLTTELINSAIETLFRGLDEATRSRCKGCLDIAAGAVIIASLTALTVGSIIFICRLTALLK